MEGKDPYERLIYGSLEDKHRKREREEREREERERKRRETESKRKKSNRSFHSGMDYEQNIIIQLLVIVTELG